MQVAACFRLNNTAFVILVNASIHAGLPSFVEQIFQGRRWPHKGPLSKLILAHCYHSGLTIGGHGMGEMLDHYQVRAERETGFWVDLPVATGRTVSRDEWLRLQQDDPQRFQVITIDPEDQPLHYRRLGRIIEFAVTVTWADELLQ